ncbi:MAG: Hpt domain-containing protein [Verrucomicrobiota bacterium]|nr:Hpt domain-containing protein [Verrucomicrobiota bacterium]
MSEFPSICGVDYDTDLPIVDTTHLEGLLENESDENSRDLVEHMFTLFVTESREKLDDIDAACADNNLKKLALIAHFLAGGAGSLGMERLSRFYQSIERSLDKEKENNAEDIPDLSLYCDAMRGEFDRTCEAFKSSYQL